MQPLYVVGVLTESPGMTSALRSDHFQRQLRYHNPDIQKNPVKGVRGE